MDINYPRDEITAVILAGGRAKRMGGADKGLITLKGQPMVDHVLNRIKPQVGKLLISANRNIETYAAFGFPVIEDTVGEYLGPLAGIASAMQATNNRYILSVPCDTPQLSTDLVSRLYHALKKEQTDIAVASDGERIQPVIVLLTRHLLPNLLDYLNAGQRKTSNWLEQQSLAIADFSDCPECFVNINSPDELEKLQLR